MFVFSFVFLPLLLACFCFFYKSHKMVPVIAIGIPMVVDAGTIVCDALEKISKESLEYFRNSEDTQLHNMYVTAKNIDETTKRLSFTLSEAINIALDMEAQS